MRGYKNNVVKIVVLAASFFCWNTVTGQGIVSGQESDTLNVNKLRPYQLTGLAKSAIEFGDYYTAIKLLEEYCEQKPDNIKWSYKLAQCYRGSRDYEKALEWYKKCYEANSTKYVKALFFQGQMEKALKQYEQASETFKKFRKESRKIDQLKEERKLALAEQKGCELAKVLVDSIPLNVKITHLDTSINKAHVELSPLPYNDSLLIYASLKMDSSRYFPIEDTAIPVRKFYIAHLEDSVWKHKEVMEGPFNKNQYNTGNGSFSPDGNRFYFSRCTTDYKHKSICAIYMSKKEEGIWQEPEPLNELVNLKGYTSTQPTVGVYSRPNRDDVEMLYFISDRPDTKGCMDIWYTVYDERKETFREPKNAGGRINSEGDELSPYYDIDERTLYYSTNGEPGLGGLDIFKTTGQSSRWEDPVNIGYPINSSADDLYFVLKENKKEGFFVSNREGGVALLHGTCCDDIYSFKYLDYMDLAVTGKLLEVANNPEEDTLFEERPLDGATVTLHLVSEEEGTEFMPLKSTKTNADGEYFLKLEKGKDYKLEVKKEGYFSRWYDVSTKYVTRSDTFVKLMATSEIPQKPITIKNIYYEFDEATLTENAKSALDSTLYRLLVENPEIIIEVRSHTDSRGEDRYNMKLSQKRAESVVRHLLNKGIPKEQLKAKGFGETLPIAPNENPNGSDNPEGRQKNRRTEFNVIGKLDFEIEYEE